MSRAAKQVRSGRWNRKISRAVVEAMEARRLLACPASVTPGDGYWLTLNQNGDASDNWSISTTSGYYLYAFMPDTSGSFTFTASGTAIDSQLRVYDSAGAPMINQVDAFGAGGTETTTVSLPTGGVWYYVAVGAFGTSTGSYTLTINGPSMYPSSISTPSPIYSGSTSSVLDWGGDTDYYQFTAPAQTDRLTVTITPGSGVDSYSILYNSTGTTLTTIDSAGSGSFDRLSNFAITAGNTYYLATRAYSRTSSGSYQVAVDFNPNAGDPPPTISPDSGTRLRLNPFGDASYAANIGAVEEYDVYAFQVDTSGSTTFTTTGALDAQFRVYDSSGNPVNATVDGVAGGFTETATLTLTAGVWYYVAVGGSSSFTGAYTLGINGPSYSTSSIPVSGPWWTGDDADSVDWGGDIDYWSVVAPAGTTSLSVSVDPAAALDSYVQVYGAAGNLMQFFDQSASGGVDSGTVTVTAGSTYYIGVSGFSRTGTGAYDVTVDFGPNADAGDPPATVTPGSGTRVRANPFGDIAQTGTIGGNTAVDVYAFMPDISGDQVVTLTSASALDGQFRVYDSSGNPVTGIIDDFGSGILETVTVPAAVGWSWYYIAVAGYGWTQGDYTLSVNGPSFALNTLTPTEPTWTASSSSSMSVSAAGDLDYVNVVAPSGTTTMNFSVSSVAAVDAYVQVFNSSGTLLGTYDTGVGGDTESGSVSVTAGSTYYIGVSAWGRTQTGNYTVSVDFNPDLDYGDPPATVTPGTGSLLWLAPNASSWSSTSVSGAEVDLYAFMPQETGSYTISTTGALDSQLRIYDASGNALTGVIDATGGGESQTMSLNSWTWYYVAVAGKALAAGNYTVSVSHATDYYSETISTPPGAYSGSVSSNMVDVGGDLDYYLVTAPAGTDSLTVTLTASGGLDGKGRVYSTTGTWLETVSGGGVNGTDTVTMSVTAGTSYYIIVGGENRTTTGNYTVMANFGPDASPAPVTISGTAGNDTISLTQSAGTLTVTKNGVPTNYVVANISSLTINGLAGEDTITVGAGVQACTIDGGLGNDSITGSDGNDFIRGDDGIDTIRGGAGNDTILGNTGNDLLYGDLGNDQIQAGLGTDSIFGGVGNDSLYGGDHSDTVYGEAGNDYIEGKGKPDTVYGGDGNDTIYGNAGNDSLLGDAGDDWLYGADNPTVFLDRIDGGAGTDRYTADPNDILTSCELILA